MNTGIIDTIFNSDWYGYSFISNPYPITIDWDASAGKSTSNINDAIYLWNPNYGTYCSYIDGTATNGQTQYISPMQGFFVKASDEISSLSFNNNAKIGQPTDFKSTTIEPFIRLAVTDNDKNYDEMVLRIKSGSTINFDGSYDAAKLIASTSKLPQLYSVLNGETYSINSFPEINEKTVIPIEVQAKKDGEHTIALSELSNYGYSYPIMIYNPETDELVNLESEDYNFTASASETVNLFLCFSSNIACVEDFTEYHSFLTTEGSKLIINYLGNIPAEVFVHNLSGQTIYNSNVTTDNLVIEIPLNGVYLVHVQFDDGKTFTDKAIIKF